MGHAQYYYKHSKIVGVFKQHRNILEIAIWPSHRELYEKKQVPFNQIFNLRLKSQTFRTIHLSINKTKCITP